MPSSSFILATLNKPKPTNGTSSHSTDLRSQEKENFSHEVQRPSPLLCSCMPSVVPYARWAARRLDRQAQWLPICRCSSCLLMHIKPTPPARRTSRPAFAAPGILISYTDRKPLSGPCRWTFSTLPPSPLTLFFLQRREGILHFGFPVGWLSGKENGGKINDCCGFKNMIIFSSVWVALSDLFLPAPLLQSTSWGDKLLASF